MPEAKVDPSRVSAIQECVREGIAKAPEFLDIVRQCGSPLYVLEPDVLRRRAGQFRDAFEAVLPDLRVYYAVKSNNLDDVVRVLLGEGLGVDVSSSVELEQALALGAADVIFSGPGKTDAELDAALCATSRVVVLADSINELRRLQLRAAHRNVSVRAGIRVSTRESGLWRKFGVPLAELAEALDTALTASHVLFEGLQFHVSWAHGPASQIGFIRALGAALAGLPPEHRRVIRFVDIGGGFWPEDGEWLHEDPQGMPRDHLAAPLVVPSTPIEEWAAPIAAALEEHVFPHVSCSVHTEPGRWLCHDAMHILVTVIDKKADDLVIVDAGTNAVGWERFESDYFPLINLSQPATSERRCSVYGSLCTPHDVWGFSYHGAGIDPGDVLLVPNQGAYTYSLRQHFIKPLPEVVVCAGCRTDAIE